ncbi:MAG: CHAT domain-containing protein, partial [Pricia sp.]|nr:CHAT domain-containing protein [Pricia sp.]
MGLASYQKAINYSIDGSLNTGFFELPSFETLEISTEKISLLNHIVTKANAWIKYYENDSNKEHLIQSLETLRLADKFVDVIRFESTEQQSKLFWREQGAVLYMKAVEVCYLLNKSKEAYHFLERNKALLLLEDLTSEEAKEITNLPKKAAQREFNLKRAIYLSENSLQEADGTKQEFIALLKDTILESKYRYKQFVDSLSKAYPEYAKFKKKVDILSHDDLKANYLSDEKAVLHYILNDEQGYGLLTSADTTFLYRLENIPKLNWDIEVLIHRLSKGNSDRDLFNDLAHTVFQNLIPKNIYNEIKGKQLTIIPDYTLQRIPFEALVVDQTNPKYLLEEVEIGYVYSMSLLDQTKRTKRKPTKNLLGLAPVQFDNMGLADLNYSGDELRSITNVFDGDIFLNGNASKAHFFEQVGEHKIIHLSTHADIGDGENPWIAFSDSKMYLKEIYATKNQSDMVVLSACNTSNGTLKRGEGLMSLARGFFYSGAKSVVSSLWPVTDDTGQEIMINFYKNLGQGHSKYKALRKAKLDYLKTTEEAELKHPFYWASFVIIGDNTALTDGPHAYWKFLMIGTLVLLIIIFGPKLFKGWTFIPKTSMDLPKRKRSLN